MTDDAATDVAKRFRSPPYPFIPLDKAVNRAKTLYAKAGHHTVGLAVLANAWGYTPKSSGLVQTISALIQFGLLADEGSGATRKFRLTNDAIRIVQDTDPNSEKRANALKMAAIAPKVHTELWRKFGSPNKVSDLVLANYLALDRREQGDAPFSMSAANDLVAVYRASMEYAGVTASDILPGSVTDKNDGGDAEDISQKPGTTDREKEKADEPPPPRRKGLSTMEGERELTTGLLSKDASFRLIVSGNIGVREIDRLIRKLEIDKEILAFEKENDDRESVGLPREE